MTRGGREGEIMPVLYRTDIASEADIKVFRTDIRSEADLVIFETSSSWEAEAPLIWCYTDIQSEAGLLVHFTSDSWDADLKVFITDIQSDVQWLDPSRSNLLQT